jgi:outer membrane lipoprotein-sorting protein
VLMRLLMRWREIGVATWLVLTLVGPIHISNAAAARPADDSGAREIVDRVARLFSSKSSIATVNMQISSENGPRNISMKIWSLGDKVLVRISAPQDQAGTAILKLGHDIWYYLPKSDRTVKLPTSMTMTSWMGSTFTIDDLVKESFLARDYSIAQSFAGERGGVAVYEYTLTPKPKAAVVWGKIVLQIRQANLMPAWQGYYDEDGKLVRELTFADYKNVGGRLIPTRLVMRAADKPDEQTVVVYKDISFDVPISAETFSLSKLKQ